MGGLFSVVKVLFELLLFWIFMGYVLLLIIVCDGRFNLCFINGRMDQVDCVIIMVFVLLMCMIDYGGLFFDDWVVLVSEIDCGCNEKINVGYVVCVWEQYIGLVGVVWVVDIMGLGIFFEFWDVSFGQVGSLGVLIWFFGGDQVGVLMVVELEVML